MADPQRRRVTITLTLTDEEFARFVGDDLVFDRFGTLAVVAVAPSSSAARVPLRLGVLVGGEERDLSDVPCGSFTGWSSPRSSSSIMG